MSLSLIEKIKKNSTIKQTATLESSEFFDTKVPVVTDVAAINIGLSGDIDGGLTSGLTTIAGPSKHFKTAFGLVMIKAFLESDPDAIVLFYDSEFGATPKYFESFKIDINRVIHVPIKNVEELKFDAVKQLDGFEKTDKVMVFVDSVGNLASKKEVDDALDGSAKADMTRAKQLKSFFRIVTPYLTMNDIPMVVINHTYDTQEMFSKKVVSGGCVVENTMIQTPEGLKAVQDFKEGDTVYTVDGNRKVTHVWNPETLENGTPECYEIQFEDGHKVTCSDKHKFLVDGKWVEAQNLSAGTDVSVKHNIRYYMKIKSITKVGELPVYDLSIEEVEHYILENGVVTHNTGVYYSSDNIWIVGRQQEKEGKDIVGWNFIINIEKSRYVIEKSKIPVNVTYDNGISKHSGLLEIAMETGHVTKPKVGWYTRILADSETGEVKEDKNWRAKDTDCDEFWEPILNETDFKEHVRDMFQIGTGDMIHE